MMLGGIDITDAPRVWVDMESGFGRRVIDPAWLEQARSARAERERIAAMTVEEAAARERKRAARIARWFRRAHLAIDSPPRPAEQILAEIVEATGVPVGALKGRTRERRITDVRQRAMYEIYAQCSHMSQPMVGRMFNRDHTTVIHSIQAWPEKAKRLGIPCTPIQRNEG